MSTASAGPITASAIPVAVEHLERAVELKPDDPVINDHLGDAYWRIGRKLEAKISVAAEPTLKPDDDLIATIDKKSENGLADTPADQGGEFAPAHEDRRLVSLRSPARGRSSR